MRGTRLLILAAGVLAAVVLLLVLRPGDDGEEPAAATTSATTTVAATRARPATTRRTATTAPARTATPPPRRAGSATLLVPIRIRAGRPVGGVVRRSLKRGRCLRLVVRSDVADEVHVHGYDLSRDVRPGVPAEILFRASIACRFEVELEERGLQIADLEVRP